jgi:glycosyltransferase involved in cell wall biosynthesis
MACGGVPVCTDIGATDFVIDGGNGRRVPIDSPKKMADAVLWYLGSAPRIAAHRENAIKTARALSYHKVAEKLEYFLRRELESPTATV